MMHTHYFRKYWKLFGLLVFILVLLVNIERFFPHQTAFDNHIFFGFYILLGLLGPFIIHLVALVFYYVLKRPSDYYQRYTKRS